MVEKEKSSLYPGVTWKECENFIKKLDKFKGKVGYDMLAQDYGLKNATAKSFTAKLSAAKQFGLIQTSGGTIQLTELAKKYLYPINGYVQQEVLHQCFALPPLYLKLIERFDGSQLPNEIQLGNILMQEEFGIVKAAKDTAAKCFFQNAEEMGFMVNGIFLYSKTKDEQSTVEIEEKQTPATIDEHSTMCDSAIIETARSVESFKKPAKEYIKQDYEIENGQLAQIIIPKNATADDLIAIKDMLDILIKRRFKVNLEE